MIKLTYHNFRQNYISSHQNELFASYILQRSQFIDNIFQVHVDEVI